MAKTAKISSFGFNNNILYVLDEDGVLWSNPTPSNVRGWKSVGLPSTRQHDMEHAADVERHRLDEVEKLNLNLSITAAAKAAKEASLAETLNNNNTYKL